MNVFYAVEVQESIRVGLRNRETAILRTTRAHQTNLARLRNQFLPNTATRRGGESANAKRRRTSPACCGRFLSPVAAVSDYGDEIMAKHTAEDPTTRPHGFLWFDAPKLGVPS